LVDLLGAWADNDFSSFFIFAVCYIQALSVLVVHKLVNFEFEDLPP
jgi:hypothetical protein